MLLYAAIAASVYITEIQHAAAEGSFKCSCLNCYGQKELIVPSPVHTRVSRRLHIGTFQI